MTPRWTLDDRARALAALEVYAEEDGLFDDALYDDQYAEFAAGLDEIAESLPEDLAILDDELFDLWLLVDRPYAPDGRTFVQVMLEEAPLPPPERACLEALSTSWLGFFEVEAVTFGESIVLRDLVEGIQVRVRDRTLSRELERFALLFARVVERGASGEPELEPNVLPIPRASRELALHGIMKAHADVVATSPGLSPRARAKELAPIVHAAWLACLDAPRPTMKTTDGDDVVLVKLIFRVRDRDRVVHALSECAELEASDPEGAGTKWTWSGPNREGAMIRLGRFELTKDRLFVRVESEPRAARARALVEARAGDAVEYRMAQHEDLDAKLDEQLAHPAAIESTALSPRSPEIEAALLDHLTRHYHAWVDLPVPALDDATPRAAAADARLRPKLVELLKDLESDYHRALARGDAGYDPSGLWVELGLAGPDASEGRVTVPPLAHESMARLVPGFSSFVRDFSKKARRRPDFDVHRVFSLKELSDHLDFQRYIRKSGLDFRARGLSSEDAMGDANMLAALAAYAINHDAHLRKTFWVGEGLSTMLDETDADVPGADLRLPFAAFAFAFTDRHVLGLAERLIAFETDDELAGRRLRVVTVYVHEEPDEGVRALRLTFALDPVGDVWPYVVSRVIPIGDTTRVKDAAAARFSARDAADEDPFFDSPRLARLVNVVLNAILYATSSGVTITAAPKPPSAPRSPKKGPQPALHTSDDVFELPGHIDIKLVRRIRAMERAPDGRQLLHRFLVRGHWRRPNASWTDQRMRWIGPYWKGPDMAAIIERAYRLQPADVVPPGAPDVPPDVPPDAPPDAPNEG